MSANPNINPPASLLGRENAILSGTSTRYYVPDFEGCLSVKSVVSGSATWEVPGRRFVVHETSCLVLNDRQRYTMTVESASDVTTFCVFFERGFVEDVLRATVAPDAALLDAPEPARARSLALLETLSPEGPLLAAMRGLRRRFEAGPAAGLEDGFTRVAEALVRERCDAEAAAGRLACARASTRDELRRRLARGRDLMLSSLDRPVRQADVAREAAMSPFHFHRAFTSLFGETPHRYLTRHRLERARHLLAHTDRSVTEVCLEAGFESPGSFSALFRREFRESPREFRKIAGSEKNGR